MNKNIFFYWNDIPLYAAYQLKYLIDNSQYNLFVITNQKNFQYTFIKKILRNNIFFSKENNHTYLTDLILKKNPICIFSSGWAYKNINNFIKIIKKVKPDIKTIMMMDNSKKNNFRQLIGKFIFIFFIKKYYDYFWVPGSSSLNLLNYFNVDKKKIFTGLYSFSKKIFYVSKKLENRDPNFVFIGQLIDRKNFFLLLKSFLLFKKKNTTSKLIIIGNNIDNINLNIYKNKDIIFKLNQTPQQTAKILNSCRYFILPSKDDHWPLAYLESVACGCVSIVSKYIGSISDLKKGNNSIVISDLSKISISEAFSSVLMLDLKKLRKIEGQNNIIAKKYSNDNFLINFNKIIYNLK